jgi:hypothetical protein
MAERHLPIDLGALLRHGKAERRGVKRCRRRLGETERGDGGG